MLAALVLPTRGCCSSCCCCHRLYQRCIKWKEGCTGRTWAASAGQPPGGGEEAAGRGERARPPASCSTQRCDRNMPWTLPGAGERARRVSARVSTGGEASPCTRLPRRFASCDERNWPPGSPASPHIARHGSPAHSSPPRTCGPPRLPRPLCLRSGARPRSTMVSRRRGAGDAGRRRAGAPYGGPGAAHGVLQCPAAAWCGGSAPRPTASVRHATRGGQRRPGGPAIGAPRPALDARRWGSATGQPAAPTRHVGPAARGGGAASSGLGTLLHRAAAGSGVTGGGGREQLKTAAAPLGRGPPAPGSSSERQSHRSLSLLSPSVLQLHCLCAGHALTRAAHCSLAAAGVAQAAEEAGGLCAGLRPAQGLAGPQ